MIPDDAELTPRNDAFPAWESLSAEDRALYARQMEVYAGYQENADYNVGRVLDEVERMGQLDRTLVFYIWGDNGASLEGTLTGSFNELTMHNGIALTPAQQRAFTEANGGMDAWGGPKTAPHCSAAWAWAGNTPFQWGKQVASHLGGVRNPMVVHWPGHIADPGGLRTQFSHVIDIGPTILEVAGIPAAASVDGIDQSPMQGTSLAYTFDDGAAAGAAHPAVLRDVRQPRHVQGRLVGRLEAAPHPVGCHPATLRNSPPTFLIPTRCPGSCTTCPTTSPRPTTSPPTSRQGRRTARPVVGGGRPELRHPAARRTVSVLRRRAAAEPHDPWTFWGGDVQNFPRASPRRSSTAPTPSPLMSRPRGRGRGRARRRFDHLGGYALLVDETASCATPTPSWESTSTSTSDSSRSRQETSRLRIHFEADRHPRSRRAQSRCTRTKRKSATAGWTTPSFSLHRVQRYGRRPRQRTTRRPRLREQTPYPFTGTVKKVVYDLKPGSLADEKALHEAGAHVAAAHGINA